MNALWVNFSVALMLLLEAAYVWIRLPKHVAIHWGLNGEANGFGSSMALAFACLAPVVSWGTLELLMLFVDDKTLGVLVSIRTINAIIGSLMIVAIFYAIMRNLGHSLPSGVVLSASILACLAITFFVVRLVLNAH